MVNKCFRQIKTMNFNDLKKKKKSCLCFCMSSYFITKCAFSHHSVSALLESGAALGL